MQELIANGVSSFGGGTYESVALTGVINITSSIASGDMTIEGVGTIHGHVDAARVGVNGTIKASGSVKSTDFSLHGLGKIAGDLVADRVEVNGSLSVVGMINAENIDIKMVNGCSAREVCGGSLTLRKNASANILEIITAKRNFQCQSIECDDVDIEWANVDSVSGVMVKIGPNCNIGRLEYADGFYADPSSKIREIVKRGANS